eukprot:TRINITY_DN14973_c0_g2_i1.p1 TRINITY_DN14973_c0_g2~~TRINITY_DN14973_c0_g2_i1.p1  ORF type:complete len:166 (+),score=31.04 TRINITY_DN14973_c0_g2_i1:56-553(+)
MYVTVRSQVVDTQRDGFRLNFSAESSSSSGGTSSGYTPPAPEKPKPCGHNRWMKQTKKKGKLVLKCIECAKIWKILPENHEKCKDFHKGTCEKGDSCDHPHIHARQEYLAIIREKNELNASKKKTKVAAADSPHSAFEEPRFIVQPSYCWRHEPYACGYHTMVYM